MKLIELKKSLAVCIALGLFTSPAVAMNIPVNTTQNVTNQSGTPYSYTTSGNITINGTLRGLEVDAGGVETGNGGAIVLKSTGGLIYVGSTGLINVEASRSGGSGGSIKLDGPVITVNGMIMANGLGSGSGGAVTMIGDTINIGSGANIQALGGVNNGYNANGGVIDIDSNGLVDIASGATIATYGNTVLSGLNVTKNLITIEGTGVNVAGTVKALSYNSTRSGEVKITASSAADDIAIASTGLVDASSSVVSGGSVVLAGNVTNSGRVLAHTAATGKNGGTISITGSSSQNLTNQSGGEIATGRLKGGINSSGGTITVNTGSATLNQGKLQAIGNGTGNTGTISITASGNIATGNDSRTEALGANNGGVTLNSTGGTVNIGSGSWVKGQGSTNTDVSVTGNGVTVSGLVEAGGYRTGNGGTLTVTSNSNNDFTLNSGGMLSARGGEISGATNGGTINVIARDITLNQTALTDLGKSGIRAYGYTSGGVLGQGGVINLAASRNYSSTQYTSINAKGTTVPSGTTYSKGVINIDAGGTANIDGMLQVGGRQNSNIGGGLIDITSTGSMTIASTALLGASPVSDPSLAALSGNGGVINLTSTGGNITINGGSTVINGVQRGMINAGSGSLGGNGGSVNVSAAGNINCTGCKILGTGRGSGGNIDLFTDTGTITVNLASILNTSGLGSATKNIISLDGATVNVNGILNASNASGRGGTIKVFSDGAQTLGNGTYNASGTAVGGLVHFKGTSVTNNALALTNSNGEIRLEGTTGNVDSTVAYTASTVNLIASNGSVTSTADYTNVSQVKGTGRTVAVTANAGNLNVGTMTATAGNNTLTASNGNVSLASGSTVSSTGGTLAVTSTTGNITNNGAAVSGSSGITLTADNGNLSGSSGSYTGRLTASANTIDLTASSGNVTLGNMTTDSGNLRLAVSNGTATGNGIALQARNAAGDGANITLSTSGTINVFGTSSLRASGLADGNYGGNINLTSTGGALMLGAATSLLTTGLTDATRNSITLNGASMAINGSTLNASASSTYGGGGGRISLSTSSGELNLNGAQLQARGYVVSNTVDGYGGTVTANSGGNFIMSGGNINTSSTTIAEGGSLTGLTLNGGNISISSAGSSSISRTTGVLFDTHGAGFGVGNNKSGGNGGDITINAGTSLTVSGASNVLYAITSGGNGIGNSNSGGNGGNITFNYGTTYSLPGGTLSNNVNILGGTGSKRSQDGVDGRVYLNGSQL